MLGLYLRQNAGLQSKHFAVGNRAGEAAPDATSPANNTLLLLCDHVRHEAAIAGDFISTVSPGFKKRSGAEVLSGSSALYSRRFRQPCRR